MATPTTLAPEDSGAQGDLETGSTVRQFVSFGVAGELFAVPLTLVHEIIRYPDIVRVPLGAPSLEGLGNLRGTVLPILSLRRMLGAADVEHDDATRVVVLNADGRVPAHLIGRAPELSDEQRRLIRRVVNLAEQKR